MGRTSRFIPFVFLIDLFFHGENADLTAGCLRSFPDFKSELFDC